MEKLITYENIRNFAYVNDAICTKPIKGIAVSFFGLGNTKMFDVDTRDGEIFAERGILYVYPYNNPWHWMNRQAVAYTDEVLDVLIEKYGLEDDIPIVSMGGSMGGQSALVYTAYSKRVPVACVTNCPVCDVAFHFTERKDLPRTFYSAIYNEDCTLEEALASISPLHLADRMPKVRYRILHCTEDKAVNISSHSEAFVCKMTHLGHDITLDKVEGRGHCNLTLAAERKYYEYIFDSIEK